MIPLTQRNTERAVAWLSVVGRRQPDGDYHEAVSLRSGFYLVGIWAGNAHDNA